MSPARSRVVLQSSPAWEGRFDDAPQGRCAILPARMMMMMLRCADDLEMSWRPSRLLPWACLRRTFSAGRQTCRLACPALPAFLAECVWVLRRTESCARSTHCARCLVVPPLAHDPMPKAKGGQLETPTFCRTVHKLVAAFSTVLCVMCPRSAAFRLISASCRKAGSFISGGRRWTSSRRWPCWGSLRSRGSSSA